MDGESEGLKNGRREGRTEGMAIVSEVTVDLVVFIFRVLNGRRFGFTADWRNWSQNAGGSTVFLIGHFRVLLCLCFKASLSAKPFNEIEFCMQFHFHANLRWLDRIFESRYRSTLSD